METLTYENEMLMAPLMEVLSEACNDDFVIRRGPFRWRDKNGNFLSNAYEGMSAKDVAELKNMSVKHDFEHLAVLTPNAEAQLPPERGARREPKARQRFGRSTAAPRCT